MASNLVMQVHALLIVHWLDIGIIDALRIFLVCTEPKTSCNHRLNNTTK